MDSNATFEETMGRLRRSLAELGELCSQPIFITYNRAPKGKRKSKRVPRMFGSRQFECDVDLNDPKTFSYLPKDRQKLWDRFMSNYGHAMFEFKYHAKDFYKNGHPQIERVEALMKNFADNWLENTNNILWFKEQVFLIEDETENLC